MKKENLKEIISKLEYEDLNKDAYLAIFYQHEDTFIKANQKGVLNLVISLLKGLKDFDFHLSKEDHYSIIKLEKEDWYDKNGIVLDYIEPTNETRNEIHNPENHKIKTKWYSSILSFLMSVFFIFLLISFFVGVFTMLKWFFKLIF